MIAESQRITSLWRAWLIAESVRRVYITAIYMQCVYTTLKRGASAQSTCPGGMNFTARAGLWDAPSAYSWFNQVRAAADQHGNSRSSSFLMVQTNEAWKVIEEATPVDSSLMTRMAEESSEEDSDFPKAKVCTQQPYCFCYRARRPRVNCGN